MSVTGKYVTAVAKATGSHGVWAYEKGTFLNYCPQCHSYGTLSYSKYCDGGQWTCSNCDCDYDMQTGWEKISGTSLRLTPYTIQTTAKSSAKKTSTKTTTDKNSTTKTVNKNHKTVQAISIIQLTYKEPLVKEKKTVTVPKTTKSTEIDAESESSQIGSGILVMLEHQMKFKLGNH